MGEKKNERIKEGEGRVREWDVRVRKLKGKAKGKAE